MDDRQHLHVQRMIDSMENTAPEKFVSHKYYMLPQEPVSFTTDFKIYIIYIVFIVFILDFLFFIANVIKNV